MTSQTRTVTIYAYLQDDLEQRIDKANRRAARIGQPGYTLTITPADPEPVYDERIATRWHRDADGNRDYRVDMAGNRVEPEYYRERITATIDGMVPALPGGWSFVGLVDEDPVIGPMPKMITDEGRNLNINLDEYRDPDTWNTCDHCHTNRDRARVYLLHSAETGRIARVGSTCIAAFTGLDVVIPEARIFALKEGVEDLEEHAWVDCTDYRSYRIVDVLALSYALVTTNGWVSAAMARYDDKLMSTGEQVQALMGAKGRAAFEERTELIDSVPADTLAELVAYARDLRDNDDSEYARTISTIVRGHHEGHSLVSSKNTRILASVVSGYQRAKARKAEATKVADSQFVGQVKQRQTFPHLEVVFTRLFDNGFGSTQLIKFVDMEGNVLVWWNSGKANPQVGETYDVTGTVKAHEVYGDVNQTALTRCKLKPVE